MELLRQLIDLLLHVDRHLREVIEAYGGWTYLILFLIIFCETGLVFTPFLPGDSLLFAAGAFAAAGSLDLGLLVALLTFAAILGDSVNYSIGHWLGPKLAAGSRIRFIKPEHLERTQQFYARYGGKTIVLARFVPIVRTFAPFVAGLGVMSYRRFMLYNVAGGLGWVLSCTLAGYLFGNIPIVQENFSLVLLAIVILSILPAVIESWRVHRERKSASAGGS